MLYQILSDLVYRHNSQAKWQATAKDMDVLRPFSTETWYDLKINLISS
jgi:hypothetical protein